MNKMFWSLGNR